MLAFTQGDGLHMFSVVFLLVGGLVGLALYFLPTIVAQRKSHRSFGGIFALNLLLGWTLLGWVGALVWALSNPTPVVVVHAGRTYHAGSYPPVPYPPQTTPVTPPPPSSEGPHGPTV